MKTMQIFKIQMYLCKKYLLGLFLILTIIPKVYGHGDPAVLSWTTISTFGLYDQKNTNF